MFHFPGCPPHGLWIHPRVTGHCPGRVPPFGYPGIYAYLQLPQAFRSLSRPSSAISALASTLRSSSLDLASSSLPFLRLLRWIRGPSDFFSECLPCAVFKVRAEHSAFGNEESGVRNEELSLLSQSLPSPSSLSSEVSLGLLPCEPSKRYRSNESVSISIGLTGFRLAVLSRSFGLRLRLRSFSFLIPNS